MQKLPLIYVALIISYSTTCNLHAAFVLDIGDDLITQGGSVLVDGSLSVGENNAISTQSFQGAIGGYNVFDAQSQGLLVGWDNSLRSTLNSPVHPSYASLVVGVSNQVQASTSLVSGEENLVIGSSSAASSILVSGWNNHVDWLQYGMVVGYSNKIIGSENSVVAGSIALGLLNQITASSSWAIGSTNTNTAPATFSAGFGLNNNSFGAAALGIWNTNNSPGTDNWNGESQLFSLGNGKNGNQRSNAITSRVNGETTLKNFYWLEEYPDYVPEESDSSDGIALIVEGHTVLKGQVIMEIKQGDVQMGPYQ